VIKTLFSFIIEGKCDIVSLKHHTISSIFTYDVYFWQCSCAAWKTLPTETFCVLIYEPAFVCPASSTPLWAFLCGWLWAILIIERFDIGLKLRSPSVALIVPAGCAWLASYCHPAHPGNLTHLSHASSSRQCQI